MIDVGLSVVGPDGSRRSVSSIASNADHVGNLIADGLVEEKDRLKEIIRLYEGQMDALARENARLREALKWSA